MPSVSVIIPTYNRASLVARAIRSVQVQTYEDWEVIVVDDASNDDTEQVVRSIEDARVRYVRHETNRGGGAARNTGVRASCSQYIAFLDSDDVWFPKKLKLQVRMMSDTSSSVSVVYCKHIIKNESESSTRRPESLQMYRGDVRAELFSGWCPATTSAFLVDKSTLKEVGLFDTNLPSFQDYDLWLKISKKYLFEYVDDYLLKRSIEYEGQITSNFEARKRGLEILLKKWKKEIEKEGHSFEDFKSNLESLIRKEGIRSESDILKHVFNLAKKGNLDVKTLLKSIILKMCGSKSWKKLKSIININ